jgi:hypothetical protein
MSAVDNDEAGMNCYNRKLSILVGTETEEKRTPVN